MIQFRIFINSTCVIRCYLIQCASELLRGQRNVYSKVQWLTQWLRCRWPLPPTVAVTFAPTNVSNVGDRFPLKQDKKSMHMLSLDDLGWFLHGVAKLYLSKKRGERERDRQTDRLKERKRQLFCHHVYCFWNIFIWKEKAHGEDGSLNLPTKIGILLAVS